MDCHTEDTKNEEANNVIHKLMCEKQHMHNEQEGLEHQTWSGLSLFCCGARTPQRAWSVVDGIGASTLSWAAEPLIGRWATQIKSYFTS